MIDSLLYITGAPGVGKSSVARELRAPWDQEIVRTSAVPHVRLRQPVTGAVAGLELGVPRDQFPGTDTLAMDISPRALEWLGRMSVPFVVGEGARLATRPFIGSLAAAGVNVTLVRMVADPELLTARWQARGAKQSPAWRKGATTRAERLAEWFSDRMGQPGFNCRADIDVTDMTVEATADAVRSLFPAVGLIAAGVPAQPVGD